MFPEDSDVSEERTSLGLVLKVVYAVGVLAERLARILGSPSRAICQPALEVSADGVAGTLHTERSGASAVVELVVADMWTASVTPSEANRSRRPRGCRAAPTSN